MASGYTRFPLLQTDAYDTTSTSTLRTGCQGGGPNYQLLDPFARHVFTTDASDFYTETVFDIDVAGAPDIGWNSSGVLVNGVPQGNGGLCTVLGGPTLTRYTGLPSGTNTIEVIDGPATHLTPGAALRGMPVIAVQIPPGKTHTVVSPSAPSKRVLVHGTSITVGARVTAGPNSSATYQCTWMLARANMAASVTGTLAGAHLTVSGASQEKWSDIAAAGVSAANVALDVTRCDGTGSNYIIFDGYEINEYGAALTTQAAFETMVGNFIDALHTAIPGAVMLFVTAIKSQYETIANAQGLKPPDYRTSIGNIASARPGYCTVINGLSLVTYPGNFTSDLLHPTTAGQTEKEVNVRAALVAAGFGY